MGKLCGIFGMSGEGKSTSTVINPNGSFNFDKEAYAGMDPKTHFIINTDMKDLPIPGGLWSVENKNYVATDDIGLIRSLFASIAKQPQIKSVSIDTLNLYLAYKEYNDRKKLTFDNWRDVAIA